MQLTVSTPWDVRRKMMDVEIDPISAKANTTAAKVESSFLCPTIDAYSSPM